jgi:nitroreductase
VVDFLSVVSRQRACRSFDAEGELPDCDVEAILEAAVHAPSAENTQPWVFIVLRDVGLRATICELWTSAWAAGGADHVRANASEALFEDLDRGIAGGGFAAAPVIVVVGADTGLVSDAYAQSSIYPAVQNMLLAANVAGYGSCMTTGLTTFFSDELRELLCIPSPVLPLAVVYLGRPLVPQSPPRRRPAREAMYRERYGAPWATS